MEKSLYVIKDIKSGLFSEPSLLVNEDCAKRWFFDLCKSLRCGVVASDLQLYYVGFYNEENGVLDACIPKFICDGE